MDMLLFWVTMGIIVEVTRMIVQKCCPKDPKKKEDSSLREPLLSPEEVLDASGRCKLSCCSLILENVYSDDLLDDEYSLATSEERSDSVGSLKAIRDDSEDDLESEQEVKIMKWDDLLGNVSVTLVGDSRISLKGKEIVEVEDTSDSDWSRSEIAPSRTRRQSRGKNSAKIYPEALDPPLTSHAGQSSSEYALKIHDQSSWDHHFKAGVKFPTVTGESSNS